MAEATASPLPMIAAAIAEHRRRLGWSASELAKRADIAKSTLSQLESGQGNPSIETLWALAVALDVPFAQLVQPPQPQTRLIRAGEATQLASEEVDYVAAVLSTCPTGARRDLYLIAAEPGGGRDSAPHMSGVVEHVVMISGQASVGDPHNPVRLNPGDYYSYPGDAPHIFTALKPGTSAVLVSEHP